jgi:hypothetical protein
MDITFYPNKNKKVDTAAPFDSVNAAPLLVNTQHDSNVVRVGTRHDRRVKHDPTIKAVTTAT